MQYDPVTYAERRAARVDREQQACDYERMRGTNTLTKKEKRTPADMRRQAKDLQEASATLYAEAVELEQAESLLVYEYGPRIK